MARCYKLEVIRNLTSTVLEYFDVTHEHSTNIENKDHSRELDSDTVKALLELSKSNTNLNSNEKNQESIKLEEWLQDSKQKD